VPFFFDLSSLMPLVDRNPFEPPLVRDEVPDGGAGSDQPVVPGSIAGASRFGTGRRFWTANTHPLRFRHDADDGSGSIPPLCLLESSRQSVGARRADIPGARSVKLPTLPPPDRRDSNITVFFDVPYTREYWFSVFPDRTYRVELGFARRIMGTSNC
jgi:hypothetical protein